MADEVTELSDKALSKFLSYVLRHHPEEIGLTPDPAGWVAIDDLLAGASAAGRIFTREAMLGVVAASEKQRFTLSPDGTRIRAAQGHSYEVDLGLEAVEPPESLWHGTAKTTIAAIRAEGLTRQSRQHVHLSPDPKTARDVGMRHGRPVVLTILAGAAHQNGQAFWQADNGVWLTDALPPKFITFPED